MLPACTPASGPLAELDLLRVEHAGPITHVRLDRPAKRNALNGEVRSASRARVIRL